MRLCYLCTGVQKSLGDLRGKLRLLVGGCGVAFAGLRGVMRSFVSSASHNFVGPKPTYSSKDFLLSQDFLQDHIHATVWIGIELKAAYMRSNGSFTLLCACVAQFHRGFLS